ncbi:MAG: flagellar assembly protein FliW [Desulfobulbaceae bacterium A2]|nr:MAG: flagellar assembly protein FliW [Desulfobulbaceae bacterium A2]
MQTINSRFGEIEYSRDNVVVFPKGLIGFEQLHNFIVMPKTKEGPLFWIQSTEDQEIAFILTDPSSFFPDYDIVPDEEERNLLGIEAGGEYHILSVVTVTPEQKITLNLVAPVLYSPSSNRALQVLLENSPYDIRTPLPPITKAP